jgi:hypothetical protein
LSANVGPTSSDIRSQLKSPGGDFSTTPAMI